MGQENQSRKLKSQLSPGLAKNKEELFRSAFKRIETSISRGFPLEAIAIIESLISDRLETCLSVITGEKVNAQNLGSLTRKIRVYPDFSTDLLDEIDSWRSERNLVLHQMVKITINSISDWKSRMKFARFVAKQGSDLVKKVHAETGRIKRSYN